MSGWESENAVKLAVEEQIHRLDLVDVLEKPGRVTVVRSNDNPWCFNIFWDILRLTEDGKRFYRVTAIDVSDSPTVLERRLRRMFGQPAETARLYEPIIISIKE